MTETRKKAEEMAPCHYHQKYGFQEKCYECANASLISFTSALEAKDERIAGLDKKCDEWQDDYIKQTKELESERELSNLLADSLYHMELCRVCGECWKNCKDGVLAKEALQLYEKRRGE